MKGILLYLFIIVFSLETVADVPTLDCQSMGDIYAELANRYENKFEETVYVASATGGMAMTDRITHRLYRDRQRELDACSYTLKRMRLEATATRLAFHLSMGVTVFYVGHTHVLYRQVKYLHNILRTHGCEPPKLSEMWQHSIQEWERWKEKASGSF